LNCDFNLTLTKQAERKAKEEKENKEKETAELKAKQEKQQKEEVVFNLNLIHSY